MSKSQQTTEQNSQDLEIKDAEVIFKTAWQDLEQEVGRDGLRFPREIILLGGAPGAGKGTHTQFIMREREFSGQPIIVSSLLNTPEMRAIKDRGNMVGDKEVVGLLFREMLKPEYRDGALLDGFPRTKVQVECLKMLVEKIYQLHQEFRTFFCIAIESFNEFTTGMLCNLTCQWNTANQLKCVRIQLQ